MSSSNTIWDICLERYWLTHKQHLSTIIKEMCISEQNHDNVDDYGEEFLLTDVWEILNGILILVIEIESHSILFLKSFWSSLI